MRHSLSLLAIACACVLPLGSAVHAQGAAAGAVTSESSKSVFKTAEVEASAKVIELDKTARTAVLRGPKGNVFKLDVPPEVKNFDQVKVGDDLVVRYVTAMAAVLEPTSSKTGIRERVETEASGSAAAGGMPGAGAGKMIEVLAVVQAINRKARTATLRGATRTVTVGVPETMDIAKIKVGDEVRAVFVEAMVLNVERAAPKKK
jgi:hypothetical protein